MYVHDRASSLDDTFSIARALMSGKITATTRSKKVRKCRDVKIGEKNDIVGLTKIEFLFSGNFFIFWNENNFRSGKAGTEPPVIYTSLSSVALEKL